MSLEPLTLSPPKVIKPKRPRRLNITLPPGPWPLDYNSAKQYRANLLGKAKAKLKEILGLQLPFPPRDKWHWWFYARDKERKALKASGPKEAYENYTLAAISRALGKGDRVFAFHGTQLHPSMFKLEKTFRRFERKVNETIHGSKYRRLYKRKGREGRPQGTPIGISAIAWIGTEDKGPYAETQAHVHSIMAEARLTKSMITEAYFWAGGGIHKTDEIRDIVGLEGAVVYMLKAYPERGEIYETLPFQHLSGLAGKRPQPIPPPGRGQLANQACGCQEQEHKARP